MLALKRYLFVCLLLLSGWGVAAPRYVLTVAPGGGEVRVMLAGKLHRFSGQETTSVTVTDVLAQGSNFVRIGWNGVRRPASVTFSRHRNGGTEVLLRYRFDGVLKPPHGSLNLALVRNDSPPGGAVLSALVNKGLLRLSVNGHPLGDLASLERRDITRCLKPGKNVLTVRWSKDFGASLPVGRVRIALADRELAQWDTGRVRSLSGVEHVEFRF